MQTGSGWQMTYLVHDLVRLLRLALPGPPHLAQQPHAQRDVHTLLQVQTVIETGGVHIDIVRDV